MIRGMPGPSDLTNSAALAAKKCSKPDGVVRIECFARRLADVAITRNDSSGEVNRPAGIDFRPFAFGKIADAPLNY